MFGSSLNPALHWHSAPLISLVASVHALQSTPENPGSQLHFLVEGLVEASHVPTLLHNLSFPPFIVASGLSSEHSNNAQSIPLNPDSGAHTHFSFVQVPSFRHFFSSSQVKGIGHDPPTNFKPPGQGAPENVGSFIVPFDAVWPASVIALFDAIPTLISCNFVFNAVGSKASKRRIYSITPVASS